MSTAHTQGLATLEQTGPTNPPIRSEFASEPEMKELVDLFLSELPQRTQSITDAYKEQKWDTIKRISHQLKGASAGYGFPTIGSAAANVEKLLIQGEIRDEESINRLTDSVKELLALCRRAA